MTLRVYSETYSKNFDVPGILTVSPGQLLVFEGMATFPEGAAIAKAAFPYVGDLNQEAPFSGKFQLSSANSDDPANPDLGVPSSGVAGCGLPGIAVSCEAIAILCSASPTSVVCQLFEGIDPTEYENLDELAFAYATWAEWETVLAPLPGMIGLGEPGVCKTKANYPHEAKGGGSIRTKAAGWCPVETRADSMRVDGYLYYRVNGEWEERDSDIDNSVEYNADTGRRRVQVVLSGPCPNKPRKMKATAQLTITNCNGESCATTTSKVNKAVTPGRVSC